MVETKINRYTKVVKCYYWFFVIVKFHIKNARYILQILYVGMSSHFKQKNKWLEKMGKNVSSWKRCIFIMVVLKANTEYK